MVVRASGATQIRADRCRTSDSGRHRGYDGAVWVTAVAGAVPRGAARLTGLHVHRPSRPPSAGPSRHFAPRTGRRRRRRRRLAARARGGGGRAGSPPPRACTAAAGAAARSDARRAARRRRAGRPRERAAPPPRRAAPPRARGSPQLAAPRAPPPPPAAGTGKVGVVRGRQAGGAGVVRGRCGRGGRVQRACAMAVLRGSARGVLLPRISRGATRGATTGATRGRRAAGAACSCAARIASCTWARRSRTPCQRASLSASRAA